MHLLVCYINIMMGRNLKENNFKYSRIRLELEFSW